MIDELFSVTVLLTHVAANAPRLMTLVVGLVVCYRQRRRRPRVARLLGYAMLAELILATVGWWLCQFILVMWHVSGVINLGGPFDSSFMLRIHLLGLPGSTVSTVIWGTVLWAVLQVEDWQREAATKDVTDQRASGFDLVPEVEKPIGSDSEAGGPS